jgi:hypothetical protein
MSQRWHDILLNLHYRPQKSGSLRAQSLYFLSDYEHFWVGIIHFWIHGASL